MKKLLFTILRIMLVVVVMPLVCMNQKEKALFRSDVNFQVIDGIVPVKKDIIGLIPALDQHYKEHKKIADKDEIIPLFTNISKNELALVIGALSVTADRFKKYYKKLSPEDKNILTTMTWLCGNCGKKKKLYAPELIGKLADVYFAKDIHERIKYYLQDVQEYIHHHFTKELIEKNSSLFSNNQLCFKMRDDLLREDIYPRSLIIDGYASDDGFKFPIPLSIKGKKYQTYDSLFIANDYEYRITANTSGPNACLLWAVNHSNPDLTSSTRIEHQHPIKGSFFITTTFQEKYAVTYSGYQLTISEITLLEDGSSSVKNINIDFSNEIVAVSCHKDQLLIGTYDRENLTNLFQIYNLKGIVISSYFTRSFKEHGLLELIFVSKINQFIIAFTAAKLLTLSLFDRIDHTNSWKHLGDRRRTVNDHQSNCHSGDHVDIVSRGDSIAMYNFNCENEREDHVDFFNKRIYSPDGTLMVLLLPKNKLGFSFVETQIRDAVTHNYISSIDTRRNNFIGVGFTHDGSELIFLSKTGPNYKVPLLSNANKAVLSTFERKVFKNIGTIALLNRLCKQYKDDGFLKLDKDDPERAMLLGWAQETPAMRNLLETCLPLMLG